MENFNITKTKVIISILLFVISGGCIKAQGLVQTIKGTVIDMDSQLSLPGATVLLLDTNPVIGGVTDSDGNFKITNVPVGRYDLKASFIGYESAVISEILVQSGKEVVVQIFLKESVTNLNEVEVKTTSNKDQAINPMAMISSRQLSVEEASRYAGGIDDPSRLATAFAGVAGSLSSNAIVIRGNAPKGLLWRMEGVEIPNPSHFANVSTFGGGGITALSSQMLSNSDFYTGAFPSEFGNALSGVFDMKIRTGNNEKYEHTFKAGLVGIDLATEGPFVKGRKSSYLINYRYSTLAIISPLLPDNAQGLKYQDLSFKINLPAKSAGTISMWGIFSQDQTGGSIKSDTSERKYYQDIEEDKNRNIMGAFGINYKVILSDKSYINAGVSATGNYIFWNSKRLNETNYLVPRNEISQNDRKYSLSFMINHKFNEHHTNRTGFILNKLTYNVLLKQDTDLSGSFQTFADESGGSELLQFFSQSRFDLSPNWSINTGIHSQWFTLNDDLTIEPRTSVKWKFKRNSLSFAYGLHSRIEPIGFYLARQSSSLGTIQPNTNLKLTKAHHIVLAYEFITGEYSRLRIEPFYQKIFDVPVIPNSSFSMLNLEMDWFFNDSLVNKGTGSNLGVDITFEKFLSNGYYYLITASLFDSKYTGGDNIERNSRFNKNYVVNFLYGKEWNIGKSKNNILGLNAKFSILGGDRISPIDTGESLNKEDIIYDESRAFTNQKPDVYYLDFTASWKRNRPKYSSTWSIQFVNLLFQKEYFGHRYNFKTNEVEPHREIIVIPNISYRIDFNV